METQLLLFGDAAARPPEDSLADAFRRLASEVETRIVYAAARRRIFSWRSEPRNGRVVVRIGKEFQRAPRPVAEAVVRIVTRRRLPRDVRRALFFEIRCWLAGLAPCGPPSERFLPPAGRHVDLRAVLEGVRRRHLRTDVPIRIGWSEQPARNLMGRYESGTPTGLIVVNRLLDSPLVPRWYLDFLVFHEVLHALIPPRPGASRILVHPPEFRRAERRHPDHARARHFENWASGPGYRTLLHPSRPGSAVPHRFRHG
jgi:hypothetical protein